MSILCAKIKQNRAKIKKYVKKYQIKIYNIIFLHFDFIPVNRIILREIFIFARFRFNFAQNIDN